MGLVYTQSAGLNAPKWDWVVEYVCAVIASVGTPPGSLNRNPRYSNRVNRPFYCAAHQQFWNALFSITRDVSVITTNYDILVEQVLRQKPMRRPSSFADPLTLISARRTLTCRRNGLSRCFAVMSQLPTPNGHSSPRGVCGNGRSRSITAHERNFVQPWGHGLFRDRWNNRCGTTMPKRRSHVLEGDNGRTVQRPIERTMEFEDGYRPGHLNDVLRSPS
jgi:hypothetical protein